MISLEHIEAWVDGYREKEKELSAQIAAFGQMDLQAPDGPGRHAYLRREQAQLQKIIGEFEKFMEHATKSSSIRT